MAQKLRGAWIGVVIAFAFSGLGLMGYTSKPLGWALIGFACFYTVICLASFLPPVSGWFSWLRLPRFLLLPGGFLVGQRVIIETNLGDIPTEVVSFVGRAYRPFVRVRLDDGKEISVPAGTVKPIGVSGSERKARNGIG